MIVVLADDSITGDRGIDCDIDGAGDVYIVDSCGDCVLDIGVDGIMEGV